MIIDKNLLSWEGSIGISVLYVKEILATKCGMRCLCLSSGMNYLYYGLQSCIFVEVDVLRRKNPNTYRNRKQAARGLHILN